MIEIQTRKEAWRTTVRVVRVNRSPIVFDVEPCRRPTVELNRSWIHLVQQLLAGRHLFTVAFQFLCYAGPLIPYLDQKWYWWIRYLGSSCRHRFAHRDKRRSDRSISLDRSVRSASIPPSLEDNNPSALTSESLSTPTLFIIDIIPIWLLSSTLFHFSFYFIFLSWRLS